MAVKQDDIIKLFKRIESEDFSKAPLSRLKRENVVLDEIENSLKILNESREKIIGQSKNIDGKYSFDTLKDMFKKYADAKKDLNSLLEKNKVMLNIAGYRPDIIFPAVNDIDSAKKLANINFDVLSNAIKDRKKNVSEAFKNIVSEKHADDKKNILAALEQKKVEIGNKKKDVKEPGLDDYLSLDKSDNEKIQVLEIKRGESGLLFEIDSLKKEVQYGDLPGNLWVASISSDDALKNYINRNKKELVEYFYSILPEEADVKRKYIADKNDHDKNIGELEDQIKIVESQIDSIKNASNTNELKDALNNIYNSIHAETVISSTKIEATALENNVNKLIDEIRNENTRDLFEYFDLKANTVVISLKGYTNKVLTDADAYFKQVKVDSKSSTESAIDLFSKSGHLGIQQEANIIGSQRDLDASVRAFGEHLIKGKELLCLEKIQDNTADKTKPHITRFLSNNNGKLVDCSENLKSFEQKKQAAMDMAILYLSEHYDSKKGVIIIDGGRDDTQADRLHAALLFFKHNTKHLSEMKIINKSSDGYKNSKSESSILTREKNIEEAFINKNLGGMNDVEAKSLAEQVGEILKNKIDRHATLKKHANSMKKDFFSLKKRREEAEANYENEKVRTGQNLSPRK